MLEAPIQSKIMKNYLSKQKLQERWESSLQWAWFHVINWQVLFKMKNTTIQESEKQSDRLSCVYGQWTSVCITVLLLKGSFRYKLLWSTHSFSPKQSVVQPEQIWLRGSLIRLALLIKWVNSAALSQATGKMDRMQLTSPGLGCFALFLWTHI